MPKTYVHNLRVYVEDTDIGGIVYNANYLKFAERARSEMLREAGLSHVAIIRDEQRFLAVKRCEIHFVKPASLDDWLVVETKITNASGVRLNMKQKILRDDETLAYLEVEIVCVSHQDGKPARFPQSLMKALHSYRSIRSARVEKVI